MNSNLTISALTFNMVVSDLERSVRREVSRGVNLPTELVIQHTATREGPQKVPHKRTYTSFDYYMAMTDGSIRPLKYYSVLLTPLDVLVTQTQITVLEGLMTNLMHSSTNTSGLDLQASILGNKEQ